jgi:hypothetical protein
MAGGEILPAQCAGRGAWTPERKLAAAVLAATLEHIHLHHAKPRRRKAVEEDLEWVFSDDETWPFAFVPLCQLVGMEPEYARASVRQWLANPAPPVRRAFYAHRSAA